MLRELKGWAQEELAKYCSINAKNISLLENDKLEIGKKEPCNSLRHLMYTLRL
jgi:transcriptional regulator with XRE-family HTH domain